MAGSSNNLDLALRIKTAVEGLQSLQALGDQIDAVGGDSKKFREEAAALSAELTELARQQAVIDNFKAVTKEADAAAAKLGELRDKAASAESEQAALGRSLDASRSALQTTRDQVAQLSSELSRNQVQTKEAQAKYFELRDAAKAVGAGNSDLKDQVAAARQEFDAAKSAGSAMSAALKEAEKTERDLEAAINADQAALLKQSEATQSLTTQVAKAEAEQRQHVDALTQAGKALSYAGINTADLEAHEQRLTRETVAAAAAAKQLASEVQDESGAAAAATSAFEQLGIESTASLRNAATSARSSFDTIRSSGTSSARDVDRAFEAMVAAELRAADAAGTAEREIRAGMLRAEAATDQQRLAVDRLNNELKESGQRATEFTQNFRTVVQTLAGFAGIQIGSQLIKDLIGLGDQAKNVGARLKIAAGASDLYVQAQKDVLDISLQTGTKLESAANLYGRLALAIKSQGGNAADAAVATRAISEAFAVSGSSAESADAAIVQLAQGLASGTLRGDELNSVLEQAPRLAQAFADALGITVGQLRALGEQGALTPQILLDALKQQAPKIAAEFQQIPVTVGRALTNLGTALTVAVGNIDAATGSTTNLGNAINDLAKGLIEFSQDNGDAFRATGDIIAATAQSIWVVLTAVATGVASASALLAKAFAAITSGETSQRFELMAEALENRATELKVSLGNSIGSVVRNVNDLADGADSTAESTKKVGAAATGAADAVSAAGNKIALTSQKFVDVAGQMAKAADALHVDVGLLTEGISNDAQAAADALGTLLQSGQVTADGIRVATRQAIDASKTVQDLDLIRGAIEKAYAAGKIAIDDMHKSVDAVTAAQVKLQDAGGLVSEQLGESAKSLGLSYDAVANRASSAATAAIKAFTDLAASGTVSIGGLQQSVDAVFAKLESKPDVEAFQAAIKAAHHSGTLSAETYNAALERSRTLLQQLKDAADPFAAAHKKALLELAAAYDERVQKEKAAAAAARESAQEVETEYDKLRQSIGGADTLEALRTLRQALNDTYQAGVLGAEQYSALVDELNSKTIELQDGLRGVAGFAQGIAAEYDGIYAELNKLSAAAAAKFKALELDTPFQAPLEKISELKSQISSLDAEIRENQRYLRTYATAGIGELMTRTAIHFDQVKKEFAEQQLSAERWQSQLAATDGVTASMLDGAEQALRGFNLLDSQTLSGLRGAIDSARQKLDSLRDSAASTLASLKEELATAQGDLVSAQQLRNQQRIADLQAQLAQAKALGDQQSVQTLTDALATLQKINDLNLKSAAQQQQQQQAQQQPTSTPQATATSQSTQTITLNVPGAGSATVTASATEAAKLQALLAELERQLSVSAT